jgi:hypothetical protein
MFWTQLYVSYLIYSHIISFEYSLYYNVGRKQDGQTDRWTDMPHPLLRFFSKETAQQFFMSLPFNICKSAVFVPCTEHSIKITYLWEHSLTSREYIINSDSMLFHEILRTVAIKNRRLVNGIFLNIIFNIKLPHLNPPPHEHSRYNVTRRTFYTMPCLNILQCCTENGVRLQLCRCWSSGL